jgi:capsular exopolysaccharide synthesis family protein
MSLQPTPDNKNGDTAKPNGEALSNTSSEPVSGKALVQPAPVARPLAIPAVLSSPPNALTLLAAFRRRWFAALGWSIVAGAIVAAALWFGNPRTYTGRTLIYVASIQPIVMSDTPDTRVDYNNYKQTQLALARSRKVLNAALNDKNVKGLSIIQEQADPLTWLESRINTDYSVPEFLRISMSGSEPGHLEPIVVAVRDAYLREVVEKEFENRRRRLLWLQDLNLQFEVSLKGKRQQLRELASDLGSSQPKLLLVKQEFAWKELYNAQIELLQVQSKLRKLEGLKEGQKEPAKDVAQLQIPRWLINEYIKKDSEYDAIAKEVAQLKKELDANKKRFVHYEKEPLYKNTLAELTLKEIDLAICKDEARLRVMQQAQEKYLADLYGTQKNPEAELAHLKNLEATLSEEVAERSKMKLELSRQTVNLEFLKDEIDAKDSLSKRLAGLIQNLEVELLPGAERRIRSMDDTIVFDNASRRWKMAAMGFGGTFGLVLLGIAYLEFRARKVNSPSELTEGLHLKLIGTMPAMSKRSSVSQKAKVLQANRRLQSHFVESVDATRLMLVHTARLESLRILLMTSAFGGEGKTMLSSHLAVNLATAGYRALLIDADLRRPALHKVFHLPNEQGLCEVLRGEIDVAEAIQPGPVEGLSLLPAGNCNGQPTQLLTRGCLGTLLPMLRGQYDYILVDSAPLLPVADSQFIAQHVDGVILSVLRNVSRLPSVHAACERLAMLQIRLLGAVVHGAELESYIRGYGYDSLPEPKT